MERIFKSFIFDGVKSEDFGARISGTAVYDAPEKDVELVNIPGRSGALIIDNNRFNNIPVTYPASIAGTDQADFSNKIRALRSFLTSRRGYKRLEDEYNLNEYRMGVYKDGLPVEPVAHGKAGKFDIIFDCKPQRYLKSGEAPYHFDDDGSIYNPTFFECSPLLKVLGRGVMTINGHEININVDPLGELNLFNSVNGQHRAEANFANVPYVSGDDITVKNSAWSVTFLARPGEYITDVSTSNLSNITAEVSKIDGGRAAIINMAKNSAAFVEGTSSTVTGSVKLYIDGKHSDSSNFTDTITLMVTISYDGAKKITASLSMSGISNTVYNSSNTVLGDGFIDSSVSSLNETLFVDCEIGEAYTANGQSYNNAISLGAELPKLSPGTNAVVLPSTITSLDIIPRWWTI